MPSLNALNHKGGHYYKAAQQVNALLGRISTRQNNPFAGMNLTHHGESRIKKCRKYDLNGFARLITIQDNGIVLFCFVGTHDDCDAWLNRNRGRTLVVDECNQLSTVQMSTIDSTPDTRPSGPSGLTRGKLFEGLPEEYFERLIDGIPRRLVRQLEKLESTNSEAEIFDITQAIDDSGQALAVYDVFVLLRQDKRQEALDRLKLFLGETQTAADLTQEEIAALADSQTIKTLNAGDPRFQRVFEHFVRTASYMDWMLFLHPDQEIVVKRDFGGPAKLVGVSGSGKTCIVVQRVIRLAEKYPDEKILILTLNRPLARLIADMVNAACTPEIRGQIDVMAFFSLCQRLLNEFEPQNQKLYDDVTWKSLEHIDEVWREFYRCELNNNDAQILLPVHDSLIARGVDAEQYIREEFDWIRSAVPPDRRDQYMTIERTGRNYPLDGKSRRLLLDGLAVWEKKMRHVGVTDYLGIATALYKYKNRIHPIYRCILVDESQDFGTIECEIIQRLVKSGENCLFFCGDAAQQVSAKHRNFRNAGIEVSRSNSLTIKKNYRNSREILRAAFGVLWNHLTAEMLESVDFEILDPEYANFSAAPPLMLRANDLEDEIAHALGYLREATCSDKKGCLAICGHSLYRVQKFGEKVGIPVLDGTITIEKDNIYLSDLEHTKGFEFDTMIIVNCNDGVIPDPLKPENEQFRDLARFYVAMTRAKNQLIVSYSVKQSFLLANAEANFLQDEWKSNVLRDWVIPLGVPPTLDSIRHERDRELEKHPLEMSGPEFLYSRYALGLSSLLIDKLRNLVPGHSVIRAGVPVAWATLSQAKVDTDKNARSRQAFGPEGVLQFRELVAWLPQYTKPR